MSVVTRFAPSPTGVLHTGSARTALFNYLFSKHHGGKFLLRIEDTDKERSKDEHTASILRDLQWLGITWDGEIVMQSTRQARHAEVANEMIKNGKAYYCYSSVEEVDSWREANPNAKFKSPWRDKSASDAPAGAKPVVRLRVDHDGSTTIHDLIQGEITVNNSELDDMVMLRSDGTPTYMLAVVVDDHDMGVTHIIRGDDHLTNAFRQRKIYEAMGWSVPEFGHIPLIHDKGGKKLSKRAGALGIDSYKDLGYLPSAVVNHLLRLGWGHGDDEIISQAQAIEWFDLAGVGKSPARFDMDKLNFINAHYMRALEAEELFAQIEGILPSEFESKHKELIIRGMNGLKNRASTLVELANSTIIYIKKLDELDDKSKQVLTNGGTQIINEITSILSAINTWNHDAIVACFESYAASKGIKSGAVMQAMRAGVVGTFAAPGIVEMMEILGKDEVLRRLGA